MSSADPQRVPSLGSRCSKAAARPWAMSRPRPQERPRPVSTPTLIDDAPTAAPPAGRPAGPLDQKGRGRALLQVWGASDADVLAYIDADLSPALAALLPLVAPLVSGHS